MKPVLTSFALCALLAVGLFEHTPQASAQAPSSDELLAALRGGGYVIVMRHASSPREAPSQEIARPDNIAMERQLDERGRIDATNMGDALRRLQIPIGDVLVSPTYRARETVAMLGLQRTVVAAELGDNGQSMQGVSEAQASWLRDRVAEKPVRGNTLFVTHMPNLARAFPDWGPTVADGEAAIIRPGGRGPAALVGRVKIDDWTQFR